MDRASEPLVRTDNANSWLTAGLVVVSLIILLFGNNSMTSKWQFAGADASDALNNVGLALLIAAITQFYTDFKVRSKFYKDISDHIVANDTLRDSGIVKFFQDSKLCIPHRLFQTCTNVDIGVTYSDRFLKDNISHIAARGDKITLSIFYCDLEDESVLDLVSKNVGRRREEVKADFEKLDSIITQIENSGVKVFRYKNKCIPHYSFYCFDSNHYFMTLSTFASRRTSVPLFQVDGASCIADMIRQDMQHIQSSNGATSA